MEIDISGSSCDFAFAASSVNIIQQMAETSFSERANSMTKKALLAVIQCRNGFHFYGDWHASKEKGRTLCGLPMNQGIWFSQPLESGEITCLQCLTKLNLPDSEER
jgi:hypothetical protein